MHCGWSVILGVVALLQFSSCPSSIDASTHSLNGTYCLIATPICRSLNGIDSPAAEQELFATASQGARQMERDELEHSHT